MTAVKTDKALILALGVLGIFPGVFVGYLSGAFIDNVLIQKYYDRAFAIILCYFILNALHFAQRYSYTRMRMLRGNEPDWDGQDYFEFRISAFALVINLLLVLLLDVYLLLFCVGLLVFVWLARALYRRATGRFLDPESYGDVMTALQICVLFLCGLFVMRGRMTFGELYAAGLFTEVVFKEALALMPQKQTDESPEDKIEPETLIEEQSEPESHAEERPAPVVITALAGSLLRDIRPVACMLVLALAGTLCQGIYYTLQDINLSGCIPSGDWNNLLRNCGFMAAVTFCGYVARKGNQLGFKQIFNSDAEAIADLVLAMAFALYYAVRIRQINGMLASQVLLGGLIVGGMLVALPLSEAGRKGWGGDMDFLLDTVSGFFFSCMTAYLYCVLGMRVTEVSAGDLILFLAVFEGLFCGITAFAKLCLLLMQSRGRPAGLP